MNIPHQRMTYKHGRSLLLTKALLIFLLLSQQELVYAYTPKYNTTIHIFLKMEEEAGFDVTTPDEEGRTVYELVDQIIDRAIKTIGIQEPKKIYTEYEKVGILTKIHSILKDDFKVIYDNSIVPDTRELLSKGLSIKKLVCVDYSFIYKGIGEIIKIPLYVVSAPEHAFIRWDSDGKHDALNTASSIKGDINWETTAGKIYSDDFYIKLLNIPPESINNKVYLYSLNEKQTLSLQYLNLGIVYNDLGRREEAITVYTKAIELNPKYAGAYNNLGNVYDDLGKKEEAVGAYKKVIELNPKDASAYSNLGNLYDDLGKKEEAVGAYKKAIELNPKDADAYYNLGAVYQALWRTEEAIGAYKKTIELNPKHVNAYNNLGTVYQALWRTEEAVGAYKKAIELNPKHANAYYNLGNVYQALGRTEEANKNFRKAEKLKKPPFVQALLCRIF